MDDARMQLTTRTVAVIVPLVLSFCASQPSHATEAQCLLTGSALAQARDKYGELPAFLGQTDSAPGTLIITVNPTSGTWSAFVHANGGTEVCMVASGTGWTAATQAIIDALPPPVVPEKYPSEIGDRNPLIEAEDGDNHENDKD